MTDELDDPGDGGEGTAATRPSRGQVGWSVVLIVIGLVVPAVAIALVYRSCREPIARGQVTVTTADHAWQIQLMWCGLAGAGARADVTLSHDRAATDRLRVFYDHRHQPRLELVRGGRFQVFDAAACTRLELAPAHDGPELDDIDLTSGSLDAECRSPSGERVVIDAWWKHCAAP